MINSYKASAPGSLMLLGEYAVLNGKPALVCAVDKRMTVTLTPRTDQKIIIQSAILGKYETTCDHIEIEKPFQFILGVLKLYQARLKHGYDILVESEFSEKVGLGSSAAVTVATLAALTTALNSQSLVLTQQKFLKQARNIIRLVQGTGSGADVAAAVYGGLVAYQARPLRAEKFNVTCPLTVLYAGFKTPTVEAIKRVEQMFLSSPDLLLAIQKSIGECAALGIKCVRTQDWQKLGEIMNVQQGLLDSLGVNLPLLQEMVHDLRKQQAMWGAKISGSGLGDCVIGLGSVPDSYEFHSQQNHQVKRIAASISTQGVLCEKI